MPSKKTEKTFIVGSRYPNTVIEDKDGKVYTIRNSELTVSFTPSEKSLRENFPDYLDILYVKES